VPRRSLVAAALALLSGCGSAFERSFVYHPTRTLEATPDTLGLPFEDIRLSAEDGVALHGWYVPGERSVTLLWCHGNAGNMSHRLPNLRQVHQRLGAGVLIFSYRGYGESGGVPSEAGTYRDARAFRRWLRDRKDGAAAPVVYFGRSLGAAIAAHLAVEDPPAALILETAFTSVQAMASDTVPGAGHLFRTRYDTLSRIPGLRAPLLLVHGDADEVVPFRHGRALFEAAPQPKTFFRVPGARHNDVVAVGGEPYWEAWERFLAAHVPGWAAR